MAQSLVKFFVISCNIAPGVTREERAHECVDVYTAHLSRTSDQQMLSQMSWRGEARCCHLLPLDNGLALLRANLQPGQQTGPSRSSIRVLYRYGICTLMAMVSLVALETPLATLNLRRPLPTNGNMHHTTLHSIAGVIIVFGVRSSR
ncbi:predicted protein [Plenodomus lingam JN3]|uniref:Predicted protein n=1 Tax=Leptosphaeria maculans (strain JN3 / isolate v23.1.3 / race Av1-4-5-6-7-8) TaxID=985895 RepID=E5A9A8_LEPMJ|nr:predicted protein [Plenodomus lingam JN3]CBY00249.1 predicted protein [Plenodomus lingam JN3]